MWEDLRACLFDAPFTVIAVAEEGRGAEQARPWIEQARPSYPCLIDEEHRVSALYGMVNVPQAVWIDERGIIVRPPETAGSTDHFRRMDLATRTLAPELAAEREAARLAYLNAVRAWVRTGKHALPADEARARLPQVTPEMAMAEALFRLALHLRRQGQVAEAAEYFAEASRLHPESWCMFRDAQTLEPSGLAGGAAFWERVRALGDKPCLPGAAAVSLAGRCGCGAVGYAVDGAFSYALNCHCSQCRRATGGAFKPFAGVARAQVRLTRGDADVLVVGEGENHDIRCGRCGSLLFSVVREGAFAHVTLGTVDGDPGICPRAHIFVGSKAPWFTISDDLPQFDGFPE